MEKLSYKEYIQKLSELSCNPNIVENEWRDFRDAYDHYCAMATDGFAFDECKIDFSRDHRNAAIEVDENRCGYFTEYWFIFYDLKEYLLKRIPHVKFFKNNKYCFSDCVNNAMLIPKIIEGFGMKSAQYYTTDFWDEDYDNAVTTIFLVTPSFLQPEEEIINISQILKISKISNFKTNIDMLDSIECIKDYCFNKGIEESEISQLIIDYKKSVFISKFLNNTDEAYRNFSIIISEDKKVKMSPLYDYDFCCNNTASRSENIELNNKNDLESYINFLKTEKWFKEWLEETILKSDYRKSIYEYKSNINKPDINSSVKENYCKFIESRIDIVKKCLNIKSFEENIK